MKKLFSIVATLALVAGVFAPLTNASAAYSDELNGAYDYAYGMGITTMSSIDNADMYGSLTRIALAKMVSNYVLELGLQTADTSAECSFADVSATLDAQYGDGVTNACQLGLMGVGIENFRPYDAVTRAEFGTVLSRAIWGDANNGSDPYYVDHLNALKDEGIMTNISNPNMKEVRGYVMLMMQRADESGVASGLPAVCSTPENILACSLGLDSCPAECLEDEEEEVVLPGFATVARVGSTETKDTPYNAQGVKVGTIKLTAGDNDSTVSSVVIARSGLGQVSNVSNVWLARGDMITDPRTFSTSSQSATVRFAPALNIKARSSMEFDVYVSLDGTALDAQNNTHTFAVSAVNVVDGTSSGTPITLNTVRTTSFTVSTVGVAVDAGSVTNGKTNQLFATVKLTPAKEGTIKRFVVSKGAGEDYTKVMANAKAYFNNEEVGTVSVTTDKIIVNGLNIARLAGELAAIEIKADAVYVGTPASTTFKIENSSDLSVEEKSSGYYMPSSTLLPTASALVSLGGINITTTKKTTGTQTVAPGSSNVELFKIEVKSDAEFDVSAYDFLLTPTTAIDLTDFVDEKVTIYVDGVDYEWKSTDGLTKAYTANADRFTVTPSKPVIIRIVGNVKSNALVVPASYLFTMNITEVKNVSNGNTMVATKTQVGDTTSLKNGTLVVKSASVAAPSTRTVHANGSELEIGRFGLKAEAERITVRKLTVANVGTLADFNTALSSVKLINVATNQEISSSVTINATDIVFDSISIQLEKDVEMNVKVVAQTNGFDSVLHSETIILNTTVNTADKQSGGTATFAPATIAGTATYNLGIQAPEVTLTKKDANTFVVVVKNVDSESDLSLESITARIRPVATESYGASYFLRDNGSAITDSTSLGANISIDVGTVPGAATILSLATPQVISKNGSTYTYEVYIDSDYVNPVNLLGEVTAVTYNLGVTEAYQLSAQ
ncbi:MAG: S-layer homology domain-containing protein, partial [Candidatus Absconditabacteria bacterium]|nr:S-layer homology domain-containing protein [Candidatus Absconditabacteria bacterium]